MVMLCLFYGVMFMLPGARDDQPTYRYAEKYLKNDGKITTKTRWIFPVTRRVAGDFRGKGLLSRFPVTRSHASPQRRN